MKDIHDTIYGIIFVDYILTSIYLMRHTNNTGVALIIIFSVLVGIAAKISLEEGEDNEDK